VKTRESSSQRQEEQRQEDSGAHESNQGELFEEQRTKVDGFTKVLKCTHLKHSRKTSMLHVHETTTTTTTTTKEILSEYLVKIRDTVSGAVELAVHL
jgi:hypothetical protein